MECETTVTDDTKRATDPYRQLEACDSALDTASGVWYPLTFPAGNDYNVSVDTFEFAYDTKLGVSSGDNDGLVCVRGNDDTGGL